MESSHATIESNHQRMQAIRACMRLFFGSAEFARSGHSKLAILYLQMPSRVGHRSSTSKRRKRNALRCLRAVCHPKWPVGSWTNLFGILKTFPIPRAFKLPYISAVFCRQKCDEPDSINLRTTTVRTTTVRTKTVQTVTPLEFSPMKAESPQGDASRELVRQFGRWVQQVLCVTGALCNWCRAFDSVRILRTLCPAILALALRERKQRSFH